MFQSRQNSGNGRDKGEAETALGIPDTAPKAEELVRHLRPSYEKAPIGATGAPAQQQRSNSHSDGALFIGAGVEVRGTISSCDELIVEGTVESTVECRSLVIAETGVVTGEVSVQDLEVRGRFEGKAEIAECLAVRASGRLSGTARYREMEIERGGVVSGDLRTAGEAHAAESRKSGKTPANDTPAEAATAAAE